MLSCNNEVQPTKQSTDPKIANLKLPEGFNADHLLGPSENGEGSWVSMTFDDKGRLIASDQYGALYRMVVPAIGDTITKIKVEQLVIPTDKEAAADTSHKKIVSDMPMGYSMLLTAYT